MNHVNQIETGTELMVDLEKNVRRSVSIINCWRWSGRCCCYFRDICLSSQVCTLTLQSRVQYGIPDPSYHSQSDITTENIQPWLPLSLVVWGSTLLTSSEDIELLSVVTETREIWPFLKIHHRHWTFYRQGFYWLVILAAYDESR